MKKIHVIFDLDRDARDIKVLVTASERDEQVCALTNRREDPMAGKLAVYDTDGAMITIPETDIITSYLDGGEALVYSHRLLAQVGSPALAMAVQTLLSGLLGAVAMGGVILYSVERLPMLWTSLLHWRGASLPIVTESTPGFTAIAHSRILKICSSLRVSGLLASLHACPLFLQFWPHHCTKKPPAVLF